MISGLWTAFEAAAATGGMLCARGGAEDALPEESWTATGLSIDTRTITPGEIFVAVADQRDGHDFVGNAFEAGASAALVSRVPDALPDGVPLLLVRDTLCGLEALAAAARDRCFGKLVGVTGSAGKTSTKEMLRTVLAKAGRVHAAEKSFNNHLGVPLTLAALPANADFGVFEIGMNHAGEITPLTKLVRPHVAIITTVAEAHLENFDSVEGIAHAKAEILSGLRPGGVAVLPRDNPYFDLLANTATDLNVSKILTFGEHEEADFRMLSYEAGEDGSGRVQAHLAGRDMAYRLGVPGRHQAMNSLAVLASAHHLAVDLEGAVEALGVSKPVKGRGAVHDLTIGRKNLTLIDEAYNANPASMRAAIALLADRPVRGRRIAVLGDMLELGPDSDRMHRELLDPLSAAAVDRVYCAGERMKALFDNLPEAMKGGWAGAAIDLIDQLSEDLADGDAVMAKGSNASRVSALVDELIGRAGARKE